MNNNFENEYFPPELSLEEFDNMDVSEEHEFSRGYNMRKKMVLKEYRNKTLSGSGKRSIRAAVIAAALVVAIPVTAYAATDGKIFRQLWGRNDNEIAEENTNADPDTNSIGVSLYDYTISINSVTQDGIGSVVEYTIENPNGVDCLSYNRIDEETVAADINNDQNYEYYFTLGAGKTYVDFGKSTPDKLYCTDYLIDTSVNDEDDSAENYPQIFIRKYTDSKSAILEKDEAADFNSYVDAEISSTITFAEKLDTKTFTSAGGDTVEISPIAMRLTGSNETYGESFGNEFSEGIDLIDNMTITYKDGTSVEVSNAAYSCGSGAVAEALFSSSIDVDKIEKITVNSTEFTLN